VALAPAALCKLDSHQTLNVYEESVACLLKLTREGTTPMLPPVPIIMLLHLRVGQSPSAIP
jgi:hypothetical protein